MGQETICQTITQVVTKPTSYLQIIYSTSFGKTERECTQNVCDNPLIATLNQKVKMMFTMDILKEIILYKKMIYFYFKSGISTQQILFTILYFYSLELLFFFYLTKKELNISSNGYLFFSPLWSSVNTWEFV